MMIDAKLNRLWDACYSDERLARLYDRPHTLLEVLTRKDGPWAYVRKRDRLWVFFRAATPAMRNEFLARTLERLRDAGQLTDPRSLAVIPALRGGKVTSSIGMDAYSAHLTTANADSYASNFAAYAAAYSYIGAASDAAAGAASSVDDERSRQLADAIELAK